MLAPSILPSAIACSQAFFCIMKAAKKLIIDWVYNCMPVYFYVIHMLPGVPGANSKCCFFLFCAAVNTAHTRSKQNITIV